jgi:hypothetical protein
VGSSSGIALAAGSVSGATDGTVDRLFRQGIDGTWYCPISRNLTGVTRLAGSENGELLAVSSSADHVHTWRLRP